MSFLARRNQKVCLEISDTFLRMFADFPRFECSLVCCIYHKPRKFDESSSEESSDSEDEGRACGHAGHNHEPHAGPSQQARPEGSGVVHELENCEDSDPNAYERQPRNPGKRKET